MDYVTSFPDFFIAFAQGLSMEQMIAAGVIALFFGLAAGGIISLLLWPVVATVIYLAVEAALPMVLDQAAFVMPPLDMALLQEAVAVYIILLVVMVVVFIVKKIILAIFGR